MNGMSASFLSMLVCFSVLSSGITLAVMAQQANNLSLNALTEGKNINGFRAEALYLNDAAGNKRSLVYRAGCEPTKARSFAPNPLPRDLIRVTPAM